MRTLERRIEAAAVRYAATDPGIANASWIQCVSKEAFVEGAKFALRSQWRPLTPDDAPPLYEDILIRGEQGDVIVAQMVETQINGTSLRQLAWLPAVKCRVVAWMPIPEHRPQ